MTEAEILAARLKRIEALMEAIAPVFPELTARELKYKAAGILDQGKPEVNPNIRVEITDAREFHCFRIVLEGAVATPDGERHPLELFFHATQLVDLIHKASAALCEWQAQTTEYLIERMRAAYLQAKERGTLTVGVDAGEVMEP